MIKMGRIGQGFFLLWFFLTALNTAVASQYMKGELIIKLKDDLKMNINRVVIDFKGRVEREVKLLSGNLYLTKFDPTLDMEKLAQSVSKRLEVLYAEPNYIYTIDDPIHHRVINNLIFGDRVNVPYVPSDPEFNILWGFLNTGTNDPEGVLGVRGADINVLKAWEITTGNKKVKIAVIDTGIDYNHPDLINNIWVNEAEVSGRPGVDDDNNGYVDDIHGYDFVNKDGDPMDGNGHGTHCSGIIGAVHNNNMGVAGVMGQVELVALKFLADNNYGSNLDAAEAIDYATRLGVDIMSNSWGGGEFSQVLFDAIQQAGEEGIIFVVAAGNDGINNDGENHYPASYDLANIITVASHSNEDILSDFSNYGPNSVDVVAPGSNIYSTYKKSGYEVLSGTSMAAPHVSGALGLMVSHTGRMPHNEMRDRLLMTSSFVMNYKNKIVSNGRLNVYNLITDTRPPHPWEPGESDWIRVPLPEIFESTHPYAHKFFMEKKVVIPNAKLIRARFTRFQTEADRDLMNVMGKDGIVMETLSGGNGESMVTTVIGGDTLHLKFFSDSFINDWGFLLEEVEVIYQIPE
ncbi:MAG: hypothetical protein A2381_04025 [Bdellovibrionales bacterium RIFOXYB1_FULL_37_110]|nr:MAG: hypothetical protein A2417_10135 [Bdellovibrionales bacterium RIFOXYC1_FULL_37_79]OFZ59090.1 MAG: hypothetical protein A2381_04025 [Bdellovibrionales bacterium RIFOXYB1_FULL_37_110]OFZ64097.1 MAG: hypothetical protein A2577_15145 [Bdellovibrionales bacterium RIFOXYD1_FULL_36_51]